VGFIGRILFITTIAYKDGILAVDSAVTGSGKYFGSVMKAVNGDGWAASVAGSISMNGAMAHEIAACVLDFAPPPGGLKFLKSDIEILFVNKHGHIYSCWNEGCTKIDTDFYALGSGEAVAIGAMAAGATAEEAVTIACKYDIATRGPVHVLRVRD